jgi:hypothetical protein
MVRTYAVMLIRRNSASFCEAALALLVESDRHPGLGRFGVR